MPMHVQDPGEVSVHLHLQVHEQWRKCHRRAPGVNGLNAQKSFRTYLAPFAALCQLRHLCPLRRDSCLPGDSARGAVRRTSAAPRARRPSRPGPVRAPAEAKRVLPFRCRAAAGSGHLGRAEEDGLDLGAERLKRDLLGRFEAERTVIRGGRTRRVNFVKRLFGFPELRDWLLSAGFIAVRGYGEDGRPLTADHERMVIVAGPP